MGHRVTVKDKDPREQGQDQRAVWGPEVLGTWGQDGRGGDVGRHQLDQDDSIYLPTYPTPPQIEFCILASTVASTVARLHLF